MAALRFPFMSSLRHTAGQPGLVGLDNIGNTCYMNSAIQCLAATQKLTDFFLTGFFRQEVNRDNVLGTGGQLAVEFAKIAQELWSPTKRSIAPVGLKKVMDQFARQFVGYNQHDSQEFVSFLLDGLHEDLNRVKTRTYLEEPEITRLTLSKKSEERLAAEAWARHLNRNRSYLVDTFQGQIRSKIRCLQCREVSIKFEPFMYLSLPMTKSDGRVVSSIDEAVKAFLAAEELSGDNRWKCPRCAKFVAARKRLHLWKMPPVLIIHLKRFEHCGGTFRKLGGMIDIPLTSMGTHVIDFQPYTTQRQKHDPLFRAYAIIEHSGRAQYGHYTATCWHGPSNRWYQYDDSTVTPVETSKVMTENAYVIFLKREDISDERNELMRRQTLGHPEDWPHFLRTASINEILGGAETPK